MIKFDKYAIDADGYGYSGGELRTRSVKKNGAEVEQEYIYNPVFSGTVEGVLQALLRREQRSIVNTTELSLDAAIQALQQAYERFQEHLKIIKEEIS